MDEAGPEQAEAKGENNIKQMLLDSSGEEAKFAQKRVELQRYYEAVKFAGVISSAGTELSP